MLRGVDRIVEAIQPTLGPLPRAVAVAPLPGSTRSIELLDDGGLIARRIVALPDRDEDAGAMLARQVIWQVRERAGDGSATAAVLFRAVLTGGQRAIEAGADAGRLRVGLERGARMICEELARAARGIESEDALRKVAASHCGDAELAAVLGEVFAVIGVEGDLEIRPALHRGVGREFVEGTYWEGGLLARGTGAEGERVHLRHAAIAVTDLGIEAPADLLAFLDRARGAGIQQMLLVARRLSEQALGVLLAANAPAASAGKNGAAGGDAGTFRVVAVRTPGATPEEQLAALDDLALLCGGRLVLEGAGQTLAALSLTDLGRARRVWANTKHFGIIGGTGDPAAARQRSRALQQTAELAQTADERQRLRHRAGKLTGMTAVVTASGVTEREGKARRELASRTAVVLREALRGGLVPGGGAALLGCRDRLARERDAADDPETRTAFTILLAAVEAPFRAIVANAGHDAARCLNLVTLAPPGHGFDAIRGEVIEMIPAGVADAARVQHVVVESAVSAAALACTIGVLVHPARREASVAP